MEEIKLKRDLVLYVVYKALKDFNYPKIDRLQVVKLLYLIDDLFNKQNQKKLSEYHYILERLGPYAPEIIADLTELVRLGKLMNTDTYYEYTLSEITKEDLEKIKKIEQIIKKRGEEIIKKIVVFFEMGRDLDMLLDYVHSKEEVKSKKLREFVL